MFWTTSSADSHIVIQPNRRRKIDNFSMRTYVHRDYSPEEGGGGGGGFASLQSDFWNIVILILLYTIQGIPMGLSGSVPMLMKERGASYSSLSLFSMVSIPFSLKLLWAPLVDSLYVKSIGRRKTWLIPVQLLCGVAMLLGSQFVDGWLGSHADGTQTPPDASALTVFFLALYFLMATQDIVVDGWALTMLSRENVGYASPCNTIGQIIGVFFANQGFIALSDPQWCRQYLGIETANGLVSLAEFMNFWAWVLIVVTVLIALFKKETPLDESEEPEGLLETYSEVIAIFRIRAVQMLCIVLVTCRAAFGPVDAGTTFKLQEVGMPKADMAALAPILLVFSLVMPTFTSVSISNAPIDMFLLGTALKICSCALVFGIFELSTRRYGGGEMYPLFYVLFIIVMVLHELSSNLMSGSMMSFFAKIADPSIGGTYMTLLNTVMNLGGKWSTVLSLWALPHLSINTCMINNVVAYYGNCKEDGNQCAESGGVCVTRADGFSVEIVIGIAVGLIWLMFCGPMLHRLQHLAGSEWLTSSKDE